MRSQRVGHDWAIELNWTIINYILIYLHVVTGLITNETLCFLLRIIMYLYFIKLIYFQFCSVQFSRSVMSSCLRLMDYSKPGFLVHHQFPEPTQTHVHSTGEAIQVSSSDVPFSSCLQSFPAPGSFQMSWFFACGQSIGVSASASVLPMNTQDSFPLGWLVGTPCNPRDYQSPFQHHGSKASILQCSAFFIVQLHIHTWPLGKP